MLATKIMISGEEVPKLKEFSALIETLFEEDKADREDRMEKK